MRALIFDPAAPAGLRLDEVPDPVPGPNEVLVSLESTSLNWGEVAGLSVRTKPGGGGRLGRLRGDHSASI